MKRLWIPLTMAISLAPLVASGQLPPQKPPDKYACQKFLQKHYEQWTHKYPRSAKTFINLRKAKDEPECERCMAAVGKKLADWIVIPTPAVNMKSNAVYPAGCVSFRSDLFGTKTGAECIVRFLGEGYYLSWGSKTCSFDGLPYTVVPLTRAAR